MDLDGSDPIRDVIPAVKYAQYLIRSMLSSHANSNNSCAEWLSEQREIVCKNGELSMMRTLAKRRAFSSSGALYHSSFISSHAPPVYRRVLHLLRKADSSGRWPVTSQARSRVIQDTLSMASGSFSVGKTVQGSTPRSVHMHFFSMFIISHCERIHGNVIPNSLEPI